MAIQRRLDQFGLGVSFAEESAARRARPHPPPVAGTWDVSTGTIGHPLITPGELRALPFQVDLARIALTDDLLVVLPTGLGKTVIAALAAAERLRSAEGKVLFLAPTRPLVDQHADSFGRWIPSARRARFTGTVRSPVREGSWDAADVVFATPQIVEHDLAAGRYSLKEVDLLVLDEAHRTVGKYAYVGIAKQYRSERSKGGHLLGLTASPGGDPERIERVVRALGTERVEARGRSDEGVREYVQTVDVETRMVRLPAVARAIQEKLRAAAHQEAVKLQRMGYLRKKPVRSISVKDLIALRGEIFARPGPMTRKFGPLFHQLVLLHLHHLAERLETQGIGPFLQYLDRLEAKPKASRGDRATLALPPVVEARALGVHHMEDPEAKSHPKLDVLIEIVLQEVRSAGARTPRVLIFAQYRDTIQEIQAALTAAGVPAARFVGQATRDKEDPGMSQKEQAQVLARFRSGAYPVVVASSVAEEGIDVPNVDLVVFFEAVPSEIRAIQRRGRTGRSRYGRVVVLLTEETRDVVYHAAEGRREKAMRREIRRLSAKGRLVRSPEPDTSAGRDATAHDGKSGAEPDSPPTATRMAGGH